MRLPAHGTYQRFIGSDRFEGCDCPPCTAAWKARQEARRHFTYYERSKSIARITPAERKRHTERMRVWREANRDRANETARVAYARKKALADV
jgi:hypothetical protein